MKKRIIYTIFTILLGLSIILVIGGGIDFLLAISNSTSQVEAHCVDYSQNLLVNEIVDNYYISDGYVIMRKNNRTLIIQPLGCEMEEVNEQGK